MAIFSIPNIKISGVSACVPLKKESNHDYDWITKKEQDLLIKTTGIEERRIAEKGVTTSDLCYEAAKKLIDKLEWNKNEIEIVIFVSQSRDYFLPATSIILQNRLGLPNTTIALDIGLGCSGYVYGLSVIASLMSHSKIKKGLLLSGDISSFSVNPKDKSTYPLFGDGGSATAIEYDEGANEMTFNLQSDGSGADAIIIPDGGLRNPLNEDSYIEKEYEGGIHRTKRNLWLDGLAVFNFSITKVPFQIKQLLESLNQEANEIDYFVFHQANKLIIETIRKKLKIDAEKTPYSLHEFGNTSSASIPLTLVTGLSNTHKENLKVVLCGFGVGLSWGTATVDLDHVQYLPLIEI